MQAGCCQQGWQRLLRVAVFNEQQHTTHRMVTWELCADSERTLMVLSVLQEWKHMRCAGRRHLARANALRVAVKRRSHVEDTN